MALDNIPTLGPGSLNSNLDKVLVYKNGGSEVAVSLLTLTNSALNLSGVYLDTINRRVGIGTVPNTTLDVSGTLSSVFSLRNGATNFITTRTSGIGGTDTGLRIWDNSNNFTLDLYGSGSYDHPQRHRFYIGGGAGERLLIGSNIAATIKGSGSTSATTSLLVQNSSGTTAFQVKDNLQASVGNGFGGDGIRFEPGNNSAIVFTQGSDRCYLQRQNSDKLLIYARGFQTYIGEGISTDGGGTFEWKMEGQVTAAVTMDTTKYVKVFINGVAYKLAVCV